MVKIKITKNMTKDIAAADPILKRLNALKYISYPRVLVAPAGPPSVNTKIWLNA